ncbi:MAG: hypothetical protein ACRDOB_00505 [Streptosporangiaceae bacterium]
MPIKDAPYGAELISRQAFTPGTLVSGDGSLYGIVPGFLVRVDPASGNVLARVADSPQVISAPVIVGDQVWAVTSYGSTGATLTGYDATTLAQVASVQVPVSGTTSFSAAGVLAGGSHHILYLGAGNAVFAVSADTHEIIRRFDPNDGSVTSLAVSPDGTKLYVAIGTFTLLTYDLPEFGQVGSSTTSANGTGAHLVATSGGVWGTLKTGLTTSVFFAPGGELANLVHVGDATGANGYSVPTYSGGTVWIGGAQTLACANPANGTVQTTASIPRDGGASEYLGGVTVSGGRAYASYANSSTQLSGTAVMTVPAACGG